MKEEKAAIIQLLLILYSRMLIGKSEMVDVIVNTDNGHPLLRHPGPFNNSNSIDLVFLCEQYESQVMNTAYPPPPLLLLSKGTARSIRLRISLLLHWLLRHHLDYHRILLLLYRRHLEAAAVMKATVLRAIHALPLH